MVRTFSDFSLLLFSSHTFPVLWCGFSSQSAVPQEISIAPWALQRLQFLQVYLLLLWPWFPLLFLQLSSLSQRGTCVWWAPVCPAVGLEESAGAGCAWRGSAPHLFSQTHPCTPASANSLLRTLNTVLKLGELGKYLSVLTSKLWKMNSFAHCSVTIQEVFVINRRVFSLLVTRSNCFSGPVQFKACSASPSLHPLSSCVPGELLFVLQPWGFGQVVHSWTSWHSYQKAFPAFPAKKRYRAHS